MSRCLTKFHISGLGEPYIYQNLVCFTRIGDFTWKYWEEELRCFGSIIYSHFQLEGKSIKSVR